MLDTHETDLTFEEIRILNDALNAAGEERIYHRERAANYEPVSNLGFPVDFHAPPRVDEYAALSEDTTTIHGIIDKLLLDNKIILGDDELWRMAFIVEYLSLRLANKLNRLFEEKNMEQLKQRYKTT